MGWFGIEENIINNNSAAAGTGEKEISIKQLIFIIFIVIFIVYAINFILKCLESKMKGKIREQIAVATV